MHARKIQLIAGTTYTVSLPKEWVKQHKLKEQNVIGVETQADGSLIIHPKVLSEDSLSRLFTVDLDKFTEDIHQILFALFYAGYEEISLKSKSTIKPTILSQIKRTVDYMSGTEIVYEDDTEVRIKVLLNTEGLELGQLFYRAYLLAKSSIETIRTSLDKDIINSNENEIDRLYHMIVKVISLSTTKSMQPADLQYSSNALPYFIIAKRIEHLGDNLSRLVLVPGIDKQRKQIVDVLNYVETMLYRCVSYIKTPRKDMFTRSDKTEMESFKRKAESLENPEQRGFVLDCVRCVEHIEEELVNISFYSEVVRK